MPIVIALLGSVVAVPLAAALGRRAGIVDHPGELTIHRSSVPLTGGIAVVIVAFIAAAVVGLSTDLWLVVAAALALAIGTADDVVGHVVPWVRVAALTAAGLAGGIWAGEAFGAAAGPAAVLAGTLGTAALILATANGVNLVDGADGLAGGTGAAASLGLAAVATVLDAGGVTPIAAALGGSLLGFLVWNRPVARTFLGNGGAYAVGAVLASIAGRLVVLGGWRAFAACAACLGIYAFEVCTTVIRRIVRRSALASGDRSHGYDLLAQRVGRIGSTLTMCAVGIVLAAAGVAIAAWPTPAAVATTVALAVVAVTAGAVVVHGSRIHAA